MNRFAYRLTGLAIKTLSSFSKARIKIHGENHIPKGPIIFVINHFTRIETLLMPLIITRLTKAPVWSLADAKLFKGSVGKWLDMIGGVSTKDPDRDLLIVKKLLTGEASWIIFPEGRMVKNKKVFEKGQYLISYAGGKRPPHSGAATLALRTEFYRKRLLSIAKTAPDEAKYLMDLFAIDSLEYVSPVHTSIVPVNITYYPIRAIENVISKIAGYLVDNMQDRVKEEIMTEGTMLLSGVDIDVRFGQPVAIDRFIKDANIFKDIYSVKKINFDDQLPSIRSMRKVALNIMQTYMHRIYSMTTVNHDHLFASILKMIPFKNIDANDLKRRVFLAASGIQSMENLFIHKSLYANQTHLLSDDRHNKFSEFIQLAVEKKIIKKKDNLIIKNTSRFSVDFKDAIKQGHTVRIDNPVAVIANEVEPLAYLQQKLRYLAWLPDFIIRKKTVRFLAKQAIDTFNNDYKTFYVQDESKTKDVGMPYLLKGDSRQTGVILVHGYMSAPLEVRQLAEHLAKKGLWVYVPRIKGHGTSPDDLATRSYKSWIRSVDEGYAIISSICKDVVAGGFSTGGGLALDLASRVDGLKGVFAVCPPMMLQDFSVKIIPAIHIWNKLLKIAKIDGAKKEFIKNKPENPHINYTINPLSGVRELEKMMDDLSDRLQDITTPALIIQSQGDPLVNPKGSKRLFEFLGSKKKEYVVFNYNRHGILLGEGAEKVYETIADFIEHLA